MFIAELCDTKLRQRISVKVLHSLLFVALMRAIWPRLSLSLSRKGHVFFKMNALKKASVAIRKHPFGGWQKDPFVSLHAL